MSAPRTDWTRLSGPDAHDRMVRLLGAAASAPVRDQEHAWRRFAEAMTDQVDRLGTDEQVVRDTWDGDAAEAAVALAERVRSRARSLVALTTALAAELGTVADAIDTSHHALSGTGRSPVWDPAGWAGADDPATETARRVMTTLSDEYVRAGTAMPEPVAGPPSVTGPTPVTGAPRAPGPGGPETVGGRIPVTRGPVPPRPGTTLGPIGVVALAPVATSPPFEGDPPSGLPLHPPFDGEPAPVVPTRHHEPDQPPFSGDPPRGLPPVWRPVEPVGPLGGAHLARGALPLFVGVGRVLGASERDEGPVLVGGGPLVPFGRLDAPQAPAAPTGGPGPVAGTNSQAPWQVVPVGSAPARGSADGEVVANGTGDTGGVGTVVALGAVAGTFAGGSWTGGGTVRYGRFSRLVGRLTGRTGPTAPVAEAFGTPVVERDAGAVRAADGESSVPGPAGGSQLPAAPNTAGGGGGGDDGRRRASWLTEQDDVWGISAPGADGVLGGGPADAGGPGG